MLGLGRFYLRLLQFLIPRQLALAALSQRDEEEWISLMSRFHRWSPTSQLCRPWKALVGVESISIGNGVQINSGVYLGTYGPPTGENKVVINDGVLINYDCQITAVVHVVLGAGTLLGSRVLITDHGHGDFSESDLALAPLKRPLRSKGPVIIGENVWIGSGAAILPGVTLGDQCVVGANSVVTRSFPARSLIGGNPARLIRKL